MATYITSKPTLVLTANPVIPESDLETGMDAEGGSEPPPPRAIRALLATPNYLPVLLAGLLFDFSRIGMAFLGPYYMNEATHSPRLVQLTGSASWAFLILGPFFGVISDRFDRRRTVLKVVAAMTVMTSFVALLIATDNMHPWVMFVYMLLSSVCSVLDTTNRPALVYDVLFAGNAEQLVGTAMALRALGSNSGKIFGNQAIGHIVELVGVGSAFMVVAVLLIGVGALIGSIPSPPKASKRPEKAKLSTAAAPKNLVGDGDGGRAGSSVDDGDGSPLEKATNELMAGIGMAFTDKAIMSMLGVTFLANFNYWSHMPLLQVLATRLEATPSQAGLLLSASGWGGLVASILVTATNPRRSGMLYCLGIMFADAILPLAVIPDFRVAFGALAVSGFLAGLFGAVQSAMVMSMVPDHLRGRALGLLTMAIGAGPFGMAMLGELAEAFGAADALWYFALSGFAAQGLWLAYRPEALHIVRPD